MGHTGHSVSPNGIYCLPLSTGPLGCTDRWVAVQPILYPSPKRGAGPGPFLSESAARWNVLVTRVLEQSSGCSRPKLHQADDCNSSSGTDRSPRSKQRKNGCRGKQCQKIRRAEQSWRRWHHSHHFFSCCPVRRPGTIIPTTAISTVYRSVIYRCSHLGGVCPTWGTLLFPVDPREVSTLFC